MRHLSSLFALLMIISALTLNGVSVTLTWAEPSTEPATQSQVDETPRHGVARERIVNVCELYETVAVLKAKKETQFDASCRCKVSAETCGKNWRGAQKKIFVCACDLPGSCVVDTCSLSDVTATAKATALCKKTSCSCVQRGDAVCAEGILGQQSHPYHCECPQE